MKLILSAIFALILLISTASANKWIRVDSLDYKISINYKQLECADSLNCIAIGENGPSSTFGKQYFRKSTDGGLTWSTVYGDTSDVGIKHKIKGLLSLSYPSVNLCVVTIDSNLTMISRDTCKTWDLQQGEKSLFSKIKMADDMFGIKVEYKYNTSTPRIYSTNNACHTWDTLIIPSEYKDYELVEAYAVAQKKILLYCGVADEGYCLLERTLSEDTWKKFPIEYEFFKLWYANGSLLYSTGKGNDKLGLIKSYDFGATWSGLTNIEYIVHEASFYDELHGIVIGQRGVVLRTTNGGTDWLKEWFDWQSPDIMGKSGLNSLSSINTLSGYTAVCMDNKYIYRLIPEAVGIEENNSVFKIKLLNSVISCNIDKANLSVLSPIDAICDLYLYDMKGCIINKQSNILYYGYNSIEIKIPPNISAGIYFINYRYEQIYGTLSLCIE